MVRERRRAREREIFLSGGGHKSQWERDIKRWRSGKGWRWQVSDPSELRGKHDQYLQRRRGHKGRLSVEVLILSQVKKFWMLQPEQDG